MNASQKIAIYDTFVALGPAGSTMTPFDLLPFALPAFNPSNSAGSYQLCSAASLDAQSNSNYLEFVPGYNNGVSTDHARGNLDNITIINASSVTTQTSADQKNFNGRGVLVVVNVTTLTGTSPTLTPTIRGKGPVSGQYVNLLLASAAIAATGVLVYLVYPGVSAASAGVTQVAVFPLLRTWDVVMTAGGTITATYTVEASIIL